MAMSKDSIYNLVYIEQVTESQHTPQLFEALHAIILAKLWLQDVAREC